MITEPYPPNWPRRLDFLPPLGLQAKINANLELYHCDAIVSTSESLPSDTISTEFGKIKLDSSTGNKVHYIKGNPNPRMEYEPVTQRELLEDIFSNLYIEVPGVVIVQRGSREKLTERLRRDIAALETSEYVFRQETRSGNYTQMLRRRLNLNLLNPYQLMKTELLDRGILRSPSDPIFRQIRSTLKTDYVIPEDETKGWRDIGDRIVTVDAALSHYKWWEAIGYPIRFEGNVDHSLIRGQLFHIPRLQSFTII